MDYRDWTIHGLILLVLIGVLATAGCASTRPAYETARPGGYEKAIAACVAAISDDALAAGMIYYVAQGEDVAKWVIWVDDGTALRCYNPTTKEYIDRFPGAGADLLLFQPTYGPTLGPNVRLTQPLKAVSPLINLLRNPKQAPKRPAPARKKRVPAISPAPKVEKKAVPKEVEPVPEGD